MKATVNLEGLHKLSSFNRDYVKLAKRAGCFCCISIFDASEVKDWTDFRRRMRGGRKAVGMTALCPRCGVDSVIPDKAYGFRVTKRLLVALCKRWFRPANERTRQ